MAALAPLPSPSPLGLRIGHVLPGIEPATLDEVVRCAVVVRFRRGDLLVGQGDEVIVLIVLEGYVSARRTSPEGRRYSSLLLRPGHVTGFEAIARATDSTDDLIGLSDGMAVTLPGAALRDLAARDAGLALRLFDLGIGLAAVIAQRLDQSVFDSAERRVATILLAYEDLLDSPSPAISRAELAALAGTSREMLGLVIRALETEGSVRRAGRAILVADRSLLRARAAWDSCGADHSRALTVPPAPESKTLPAGAGELRLVTRSTGMAGPPPSPVRSSR